MGQTVYLGVNVPTGLPPRLHVMGTSLVVSFLCAGAGCGSSSPSVAAAPVTSVPAAEVVEEPAHDPSGPVVHTGVLEEGDHVIPDDGSWADDYTFDVQEGWVITAVLRSTDFDPYVWVLTPAMDSAVQMASQPGTHEVTLTYKAEVAGAHVVRANSNVGGERGAYTLEIHVEQLSSDANPSAH